MELPPSTPVIDVGGGSAALVDALLADGWTDVTVLDLSPAALEVAQRRLGDDAARAHWVVADVRTQDLGRTFGVWHDRAVFHFLTHPADRQAYVDRLTTSLAPGGHAILGTFGPTGPTTCSGLPVLRYDAAEMADVLGPRFELRADVDDVHRTPAGIEQPFVYAVFRRR